MKGNLRFLVVEDLPVVNATNLRHALFQIKETYEKSTGGDITVSWVFDKADLSDIQIHYSWFSKQYRLFEQKYKDTVDFLVLVVSPTNWHQTTYWGIHSGIYKDFARNPYSVIAFKNSPMYTAYAPKITLSEEIAHSFNDWPKFRKPNVDVVALFGVQNYDEEIVHGHRYDYGFVYEKLKPYFVEWFPSKQEPPMALKLVITPSKEQWVEGLDKKAYHVYNVDTLRNLFQAGVVSLLEPFPVDSVEDSGKEIIILDRE